MKSLNTVSTNSLQKLSSVDYIGEWINVTLGKDRVDRRFIKPNFVFENPSGNAICLGNGPSRQEYPLWKFGLTNKRKIARYHNVMYGCNGIFREWHPDFLVTTHQLLATQIPKELKESTYAPQEISRRYAGMNLLPGCQRLDAGSAAAYLAAFHGAKRVFLYGYDGQQDSGTNNNVYAGTEYYPANSESVKDDSWVRNLTNVVETYSDVEFIRVTTKQNDSYKFLQKLGNYKIVNFRQFISLADL
jgi:hypothetical protein